MALKYYGFSEKEVLHHLGGEYQGGLNLIQEKRQIFRDRIKDYTNITTDKEKVYVRFIYSVMQTLMSLNYTDEMQAQFVGRQLGAEEIADNIQNLANFDFDEMELDKVGYRLEWDRLFYGKALLVFDRWDKVKKHPVYRPMSPMARVPDTNPDPVYGPRFHQFELEIDSSYLIEERGFVNIARLKNDINQELEQNKEAFAQNRSLQYQSSGRENTKVPIHYCYTHLNGEKYFIVTALGHNRVIKMEKIEAVWEEEKKDSKNIKFPVIEFAYSPHEGDPRGVSIPDLLADKQRAQQLLLNLETIKARHAAFGDTFLVDTNKINIKDLVKSTTGTRYVPIKDTMVQDLSQVMVEVQKSRPDADVMNMSKELKLQAQYDIGLDDRSLGISGDNNITATENQRIQKNANLKQVLQTKVKQWGWKDFWSNWYRAYYDNFKYSDEKNIILNGQFGSSPMTVKKKDIITGYDIDIRIVSKSDQETLRENQKIALMATAPIMLQDPTIPKISRDFLRRRILMANGLTKEEANMYIPPSIEEMKAMQDLELINRNVLPDIPDTTEDIMTYLLIYQRAIATLVKWQSIEALKMMYTLSGQQDRANMMGQQPVGVGQVEQQSSQSQGALAKLANNAIQHSPEAASLGQ